MHACMRTEPGNTAALWQRPCIRMLHVCCKFIAVQQCDLNWSHASGDMLFDIYSMQGQVKMLPCNKEHTRGLGRDKGLATDCGQHGCHRALRTMHINQVHTLGIWTSRAPE